MCVVHLFAGASPDHIDELQSLGQEAVGLKVYLDQTFGPLRVTDLLALVACFRNWRKEKMIAMSNQGLYSQCGWSLFSGMTVRGQVRRVITTEDGLLGAKGVVTSATEAIIHNLRPNTVYACGPIKMLEAIDRQGEEHNLPRQLAWEAHMRCGIGLCGSCELPPRSGWLTCLDGPVSFSR